MNDLEKIKVGDRVYRSFGWDAKPMELKVTLVTESQIICGAYVFSRVNGAEIDEMIGWDEKTTGSILKATP